MPRRPCGPPRNDKRFLSFRGAERRGNPFPFTMDGGSGRRGRRPLRKRGIAAATTQASDAQRSVCAAVTRSKRESAQRPSKRGSPPRPPRQRLAKRKARKEQLVKFDLCPIPSECSTAQKVRKSDKSPARAPVGAASIEQNSLEPHPAARQGASRARNCAATSVFSFDGSTAVFFLGRQKENGGGKLRVTTRDHAPFGAAAPRHAGVVVPSGGAAPGRCRHRPLRVRHRWCTATPSGGETRSFLLASSATGGARKRPPLHKGSLGWGKKPRRPLSRSPCSVQLT